LIGIILRKIFRNILVILTNIFKVRNFIFFMKMFTIFLILIFFFNLLISPGVKALANPAAVYCKELGYKYRIEKTETGEEYGICEFPNGSECEEWEFLKGKCGKSYSYCAKLPKLGLEVKTVTRGIYPNSYEQAVCVHNGKEIGPVTDLMNLNEKLKSYGELLIDSEPQTEITISHPTTTYNAWDWSQEILPGALPGQDYVTGVKNQGDCDSCWAFSVIGALESKYKIHYKESYDPDLSEQDLVSCGVSIGFYEGNPSWGGCGGATVYDALQYIYDPFTDSPGVCSEESLPYTARDDPCNRPYNWQWQFPAFRIDLWGEFSSEELDVKEQLRDKGPIVTSMLIDVRDPVNGIYKCDVGDPSNYGQHIILIIGYNDDENYWIAKNSWGPDYGVNGFFKIGYGECQMPVDGHFFIINNPIPAFCEPWGGPIAYNTGKNINGVCDTECDALDDRCDGKSSGSWCDGDIKKTCNLYCQYSEKNCKDYGSNYYCSSDKCVIRRGGGGGGSPFIRSVMLGENEYPLYVLLMPVVILVAIFGLFKIFSKKR
jgi:hypothetical protein